MYESTNILKGRASNKLCPLCNQNRIANRAASCNSCRDHNNPFYGKHHSPSTIEKLREANSGDNSWIKNINPELLPYTKRYQVIWPSGETKIFAGLKILSKEFKVSIECVHATIKRIADGKIPKRGAFKDIIIKDITISHLDSIKAPMAV